MAGGRGQLVVSGSVVLGSATSEVCADAQALLNRSSHLPTCACSSDEWDCYRPAQVPPQQHIGRSEQYAGSSRVVPVEQRGRHQVTPATLIGSVVGSLLTGRPRFVRTVLTAMDRSRAMPSAEQNFAVDFLRRVDVLVGGMTAWQATSAHRVETRVDSFV